MQQQQNTEERIYVNDMARKKRVAKKTAKDEKTKDKVDKVGLQKNSYRWDTMEPEQGVPTVGEE